MTIREYIEFRLKDSEGLSIAKKQELLIDTFDELAKRGVNEAKISFEMESVILEKIRKYHQKLKDEFEL